MLSGLNEEIALPILARRPVLHFNSKVLNNITGRVVLVTGAGGSIGSELVLQITEAMPTTLILLDHSEYAMYEIMQTLSQNKVPFHVVPVLVDVRDFQAVEVLFRKFDVDVVIHAAAYKHVPLLENDQNALEGLRVNVLGTHNLLTCCSQVGGKFVLISSDKAAEPSSFMGLTKRLAEFICMQMCDTFGMDVSYVRFGNVLGSSGSVVPLFKRQIAQGGPVTVTHPDMKRYFMSIKQAVQLVLSVASLPVDNTSTTAGLYVLDMGQPVRIVDIATGLINQAGLRPGVDIQIEYVGMRPGEKLEEVLAYPDEHLQQSSIAGVSTFRRLLTENQKLSTVLLSAALRRRDVAGIKHEIEQLVPDYKWELDPWL